jgi:AraC-like DNA-binding protein
MTYTKQNTGYDKIAFVAPEPGYWDLPFCATASGWSVWRKGNCYGTSSSPEWILSMNLYGTLHVVVHDDREYVLSAPGNFMFLHAGSSHFYACESEYHADRFVAISGLHAQQTFQSLGMTSATIIRPRSPAEAERLLIRIHGLLAQSAPEANLAASGLAYQLVLHLAMSTQNPLPRPVTEAVAFIHRNLARPLSNSEIAVAVGLSRSRLCALFQESFRVSPLRYHRDRRMEMAKSLLRNTNRSVKEIAASLSYSDPLCFSRDFKRYEGEAPLHWRRG